jgi:hypothetical protein
MIRIWISIGNFSPIILALLLLPSVELIARLTMCVRNTEGPKPCILFNLLTIFGRTIQAIYSRIVLIQDASKCYKVALENN